MTRLRRPFLLFTILAAVVALAACGSDRPVHDAADEGTYVTTGNLYYQVQLSRELNPNNIEDRQYLEGLPAGTTPPTADEEWFGVWLRVQNDTKQRHRSASTFRITDTVGNSYAPIALPARNPYAYHSVDLERDTGNGQPVQPGPESGAYNGPVQGEMLLFKLPTTIYANRPLTLHIMPPDGSTPATVELDL